MIHHPNVESRLYPSRRSTTPIGCSRSSGRALRVDTATNPFGHHDTDAGPSSHRRRV